MLQGDWGFSFASRVNVDTLILQRLPATLFVIGSAQLLALLIAIPVGVYAATRPYSIFDQIASTLRVHRLLAADLLHRACCSSWCSASTSTGCPSSTAPTSAPPAGAGIGSTCARRSCRSAVLGLFLGGLADALRALRRARRHPPRLRHDGARQGPRRARGHHQARGAQRADPGGDAGGAADAGHLRRRHRDRADLPHSRHRLAADQLDPRQRHARRHGGDIRVRLSSSSSSTSSRTSSMAGSTLASPSAEVGNACAAPDHGTSRRGWRHGAASAAIGWPW